MGYTWTEVDGASDMESFINGLKQGKGLTKGEYGTAVRSAYSVYSIAYTFYRDRLTAKTSKNIATAKSSTSKDGSKYTSMSWKNNLLLAEQTNYAYAEEGLIVIPQGKTSLIKLIGSKASEDSFTASVKAEFTPELITTAEWGGFVVKYLDSAKVAAKGTLSLTALAQYDFSAAGSVSKEFQLFRAELKHF